MIRIKRLLSGKASRRGNRPTEHLIRSSGLFDESYYLATNADVAKAGVDPLTHYLNFGQHEGRRPSKDFDPRFYLQAYPDVRTSGLDPFEHFIRYGLAERRQAKSWAQVISDSSLFDANYYRAANLDVTLAGCDPLQHYLDFGKAEGRRPSLDFDPAYYLDVNPDIRHAKVDPLLHYVQEGSQEGRLPHGPGLAGKEVAAAVEEIKNSGRFDTSFYLGNNPALRLSGIDPIFHYVVAGHQQFLDPSPVFSAAKYLAENPKAFESGINPLTYDIRQGPQLGAEVDRALVPETPATAERRIGVAFFSRYLFTFNPEDAAGKFARDAVAELSTRSPVLKIERQTPDVSIVVPVYGQLAFALGCLDSLSLHNSKYSAEIIVMDDASPDASQTRYLGSIPWINYQRREQNGGFIETCNEGGRAARGRFLVFLNSDTRVVANWLDELIDSFQIFPKAGLIGSKLLNGDGTLQEAGGIFWRDASAWNYGRNHDPGHPKYSFARQVDYVSGASIALPTEVWHRMGGFDVAYRPAYCEDSDLAFRLRAAGYEVWFQPLSIAIHYEGKTHGRDLNTGGKAYQVANMRRIRERWGASMATHRPNGCLPDLEANRMARERLLFIDALTPRPDRDAGSIFTVQVLRAFHELGYQITFVAQHDYGYKGKYTNDLQRLGIECLYSPFFCNIEDVLKFRDNFDIVFGCRVNVVADIYAEIRKRLPSARIIFENADLHYLREEREAFLTGNRSKRIAAAMTKSAELELMAKVDCTIVHTNVETQIIKQQLPVDNIVEFAAVYDIKPTSVPFEKRFDVMFLGGFLHTPNIDAVMHFVKFVWPLLVQRLPQQARFVIVGSSPPREVLNLASERIIVVGFVEDLAPTFDTARVFVAPLRYGAGIKGKVIQSLCHGTPAVMTSIAAEGIGLTSGKDAMIADADRDFAEAVEHVYFNQVLWYSLQTAGYRFVENNYSWARCHEILKNVLDTADATWLARQDHNLRLRLEELTSDEPLAPKSIGKHV